MIQSKSKTLHSFFALPSLYCQIYTVPDGLLGTGFRDEIRYSPFTRNSQPHSRGQRWTQMTHVHRPEAPLKGAGPIQARGWGWNAEWSQRLHTGADVPERSVTNERHWGGQRGCGVRGVTVGDSTAGCRCRSVEPGREPRWGGGQSQRQEADHECRMLRPALFQIQRVLLSGGQHGGWVGRNRGGRGKVRSRPSQLSRHGTLRLKARGGRGAYIQWNMTEP